MTPIKSMFYLKFRRIFGSNGFTLIEVMVGIAVMAIVSTVIMGAYMALQQGMRDQRFVSEMQQNLRGSVFAMEQDIRMTGFDPQETGNFGVVDILEYAITDEQNLPGPLAGGSPSLTVTSDWNENGVMDDGVVTYRLFDDNNDGIRDLVRDTGAIPRPLVAEGIQNIGFAYAIDDDGDGRLDTTAGGNTIWAVDSNNDNFLDTNLDTNDDGRITIADAAGNNLIESADNAAGVINPPVPRASIRVVQIWLLARTQERAKKCMQWGPGSVPQYVVGRRIVTDPNNCFKYRQLARAVECRNMGI